MTGLGRQCSRTCDPGIWAFNGTIARLLSGWELNRQVQLSCPDHAFRYRSEPAGHALTFQVCCETLWLPIDDYNDADHPARF